MWLCLRIAVKKQDRHMILGTLGCRAFTNPPQGVLAYWLEVFLGEYLNGSCWEIVCFAVYDSRNEGNFAVF